ncbi:MAG: TraB/GumN family protein [Kofleriaceae bacterium]|nr:TraB/GumN family protein [Kofleriaceae bacterium]
MSSRTLAALVLAVTLVGCGDRERSHDQAPEPLAPSGVETNGGPLAARPPPPPHHDPWAKPAEPSLADTVCPKVLAPYFYRIEKDGKVSHMLGTRHIGVALYKMPPVVVERLKASTVFVSEVGPEDRQNGPNIPARVIPLSEQLGPELWKRYRELGGDALADDVVREKPSTALLRLMVKYEDLASALDNELEQLAREQGLKLTGLETSMFQDRLINRWLDLRMLRAYLAHTESLDEIRTDTGEDVGNYCKGVDDQPGIDGKQRADMLDSGYTEAELAKLDQELLFDRNRDWIPKLAPILAAGGAFIAVGADHLRGEQGVPSLLRAEGYKVERVTPPN